MASTSYFFRPTVPAGLHFRSPFGEIVETTGTLGEPFEHYQKIFRHEVIILQGVFRKKGTRHFVDLTDYKLVETTPQNEKMEQPGTPQQAGALFYSKPLS